MDIDEIKIKLSECLEERNRLFPRRDEKNDREVAEALTEFALLVNTLQGPQFNPDNILAGEAQSVLESPLFLCGSMKSGTTLLLELLDGHSELIVLPGDSFFLGKISKADPPSEALLQTAWDNWVKRMVNPTGQKPFWIFGYEVQPYVNFRQYLQYWYDQFPNTWRSSVVSVMLSYYCSNPVRPSWPKIWVEKTPGNEFRLKEIVKNFPKARFIHIVRDPRENMASLKKLYSTRKWKWEPIAVANTLAGSFRAADENQQLMGRDCYHVLNYEALTEKPKKSIEEVAKFLGIGWENDLLKPTVNGKLAHANSMYEDRKVTGEVRQAKKDKWRSVLTKAEQRIAIGTLEEARRVGYEWQKNISDSVLLMIDKGWAKVRRATVIQKF